MASPVPTPTSDIFSRESSQSKWTIRNSINLFSFKLFKVYATRHHNDSKNICFSPLEVYNSLVMVLIGAKGESESQLEEMLCLKKFNFNDDYDELIDLREWIIKSNHDIMVYGSFIYMDYRVQIEPEYLEKLKNIFEMKPKRVDFTKVDQAINIINKDAYSHTDGVVEGVISRKDLRDDPDVKLVISNAVFFRGYWLYRFSDIKKEDFYYSSGTKIAQVDMMSQVGLQRYYYDPELSAQAVSLPYASSDIRMVIILPDDPKCEAVHLVEMLSSDKLNSLFGKLQKSPKSLTELSIPRFALEAHKVSLQKSVKQMGATLIYDNDLAQLTGITNDSIHLTKLVHKAFILVDERGSHTSITQSPEERFMNGASLNDSVDIPVVFKANHTFVYIILDKITGVVCFMGVFSDPTEILEVVNEKVLSREEIQELLTEEDMKLDFDSCKSSTSC